MAVVGAPNLTLATLKKLFAKALARTAGKSGAASLDALEIQFLEQALEDYIDDETPELGPEDLANVLAEFWRYGETRPPKAGPMIRVIR